MDKNVIPKSTKQKGPLLKMALVGDSEVGKTSIINTFIVNKIFNTIERINSKRKIQKICRNR
jgi:GTPase SAR1 family protein